jgi:Sec7-like guanine-nucleotide exchange factor
MGITFMTDILREMSSLNVQFQRDHIDLTTIRQTIEGAVADLKDAFTADSPQLTVAGGENQLKNLLTTIQPQVRGIEVSTSVSARLLFEVRALFVLKSEMRSGRICCLFSASHLESRVPIAICLKSYLVKGYQGRIVFGVLHYIYFKTVM